MKAQVLANLPEEYKPVCTNLYMNSQFNYEDYQRHIRNYWYAKLGGKDMINYGTMKIVILKRTERAESTKNALNTMLGNFPFRCRKRGMKGHKAIDCKAPMNKRQKFTR